MTLELIQNQTRKFADAHRELCEVVEQLKNEVETAKRKKIAAIQAAVTAAATERAKLKAGIESSPELFADPRTVVIHGVKIGLQKGKGGIEFDDPAAVVARIEKLYEAERATELIHTEKTPNKTTLADLPAAELKKLGVEIVAAGDQVVIKPAASDVDKIVAALLKSAAKEVA